MRNLIKKPVPDPDLGKGGRGWGGGMGGLAQSHPDSYIRGKRSSQSCTQFNVFRFFFTSLQFKPM